MQSTSARASQHIIEESTLNSLEHKKPSNECIPDISSPSSYTQTAFQEIREIETTLHSKDATATVKCILLGDSNVGKSSLVISYTSNGFPDNHKSTAFDVYKVEINVEERRVQLQICDTGGGDEVSSLRYLAYPDCHTFILCFSVIDPSSFYNLINHWFKEIESYSTMNNAAVLLVGCRCDERNNVSHIIDLSAQGEGPITERIVRQYADKLRADAYVECSALTQKNLKRVFDLAIWYSMRVYDRCVIEENRLAIARQTEKESNNHKKVKKQRLNSYKVFEDDGIRTNGINNNNNNSNMKLKNSTTDIENKSLWKRLFCLS